MKVEDGLNVGTAEKICVNTFKNDIAHMTLEIASPRVLEVVRDKRVTFPDMLGTVGNITPNTYNDKDKMQKHCFSAQVAPSDCLPVSASSAS
jgi:hypothetical protein